MSQINVANLTFGYHGSIENVFEDVSFVIDTDWKLGLIGRNGKGKTTFLKLLLGMYKYTGSISKNINFDYFPFKIKDSGKMTIEILQSANPDLEDWKVIKELNLLETNIEILYRNFDTLSGGEQIKVMLAALFSRDNNFLLIDEPTNHLDLESKKAIEKYLKNKKGFILVSHDRTLIDNVVDHILAINNTNIEVQKGNFSSWKENKDRQDKFEIIQNEKLKKDINKLEEATKRTKDWSDKIENTKTGTRNSGLRPDRGYIGHQAAKMMQRAKATEKRAERAVEDKSALLKNVDRADDLIMKPLIYEKPNLIYATNLSIKYGEKILFDNINFEVNRGDRLAILGKNGSGKSSILKIILGEKIEYIGNLSMGNNIKISYVSQDTSKLQGTLRELAKEGDIDEGIFKAMLAKLGFSSLEFEKDIFEFSEGQKKKILIAKSITESSDLYIWDEPLNFIDIASRMQIEECILKYGPTMIFVDHDETFTNNIATKKLNIV